MVFLSTSNGLHSTADARPATTALHAARPSASSLHHPPTPQQTAGRQLPAEQQERRGCLFEHAVCMC